MNSETVPASANTAGEQPAAAEEPGSDAAANPNLYHAVMFPQPDDPDFDYDAFPRNRGSRARWHEEAIREFDAAAAAAAAVVPPLCREDMANFMAQAMPVLQPYDVKFSVVQILNRLSANGMGTMRSRMKKKHKVRLRAKRVSWKKVDKAVAKEHEKRARAADLAPQGAALEQVAIHIPLTPTGFIRKDVS